MAYNRTPLKGFIMNEKLGQALVVAGVGLAATLTVALIVNISDDIGRAKRKKLVDEMHNKTMQKFSDLADKAEQDYADLTFKRIIDENGM